MAVLLAASGGGVVGYRIRYSNVNLALVACCYEGALLI
jgi:hypothetical protein